MYDSLLANVLTGIALVLLFAGVVTLYRTPGRNLPRQSGRTARKLFRAYVLMEAGMGVWIAAGWVDGTDAALGKAFATALYIGLLFFVIPRMKRLVRIADENDAEARANVE
ncbi:hypothetical protein GRS96_19460 (plasmid) [Rathayibacter sp. VKM Ac-2803]|uniref:Uncharacterized protein n=1 Tax=Rathayibacter caricis DSM 15933 TaxID=1328867 RepID=A0A2T4UP20_9MICO|nr:MULTISPECIES: hypothetical protein [Rathayibacter]MWV51450.1 hypothetical protein [Rathayibacter sp. VKM Ac-2803]PTL71280.1 hypothetical protein C1I63_18805 [Rathayibacter caricis DSM 15933]